MEAPSTRVLQPPGGGSNISFSNNYSPETKDVSPASKKEAADKRNKSSIFDDGDEQQYQRKVRADDNSSNTIFGSAPEEKRRQTNYLKSSVFQADGGKDAKDTETSTSSRPVKDYMRSTIFSGDDDKKNSPVKNYQKSDIFGVEEQENRHQNRQQQVETSTNKREAFGKNPITGQGIGRSRHNHRRPGSVPPSFSRHPLVLGQSDERKEMEDEDDDDEYEEEFLNRTVIPVVGRSISRQRYHKQGTYNPITGASLTENNVSTTPTRPQSATAARNPILLQAETVRPAARERTPSPLSVNRQRNREGSFNPITGGATENGEAKNGKSQYNQSSASTRPW